MSGTPALGKDIRAANTGELAVSIEGPAVSPFGVPLTAEPVQVFSCTGTYGLNTSILTLPTPVGTGSADTNASRMRVQTGATINSSAIIKSRRPFVYRAGLGNEVLFTPMFTTSAASSSQYVGVGIGTTSPSDGYFVGYSGTSFGIFHFQASSPGFVARTAWNGDRCDGSAGTNNPSGFTWDPTKGVPVRIVYPYLGHGNVKFYVQNPTTSEWILFHTIRYANSSTAVLVANPSLHFWMQAISSGSTTNLTVMCSSAGAFLLGPRVFTGPQGGAIASKAGITTEQAILSLRVATTYNTVTNEGIVRLRTITLAHHSANNSGIFRVYLNTTVTAIAPAAYSGTTVDGGVTITSGQSVVSTDSAGTTVTGGSMILPLAVGQSSGYTIDVTSLDIFAIGSDLLTITGISTNAATMTAGFSWQEDH
jgi:hypothetical protein